MTYTLAFIFGGSIALADESLSLLQRHSVQINSGGPNPSAIPAGCQPQLIAEHKRCSTRVDKRGKTWTTPVRGGARMTGTPAQAKAERWDFIPKTDGFGWSNSSMTTGWPGPGWPFEGILGAWTMISQAQECCSTKFAVCKARPGHWHVFCSENLAMKAGVGDLCDTFEDYQDCYVYDAATESCGTADLKDKGTCTLHEYQIKDGCKPVLAQEHAVCTRMDSGGSPNYGRTLISRVDTVEECMVDWAKAAKCCGARIDWDPVTGECGCAERERGYNGVPHFCQDVAGTQDFTLANSGTIKTHQYIYRPIPGRDKWIKPTKPVQPAVYDIGHCMHPHLHPCPVDPGDFKQNPCDAAVTGKLEQPLYSNLGDQGPDTGKDGILFPDAITVDGTAMDLKLTAPSFVSFRPSNNGASGGLGRISVLSGTEAEVVAMLVHKNGQPANLGGTFAITFLDMDEGKKGRSRTTVSSCQPFTLNVGSELTTAEDGPCKSVSSSKKGRKGNEPPNFDGITEEHKVRAATLLFESASEYRFKIGMSKGPKGRNVYFILSALVGCQK